MCTGLSLNTLTLWGEDENFLEWSSANIVFATLSLQWRPTERLRVDGNYQLQSFERRTDGSMAAIRRIPRVKLEYQATRAIFVRWVGEYDSQYQADLRDDSRTGLPIVVRGADGTPQPGARLPVARPSGTICCSRISLHPARSSSRATARSLEDPAALLPKDRTPRAAPYP